MTGEVKARARKLAVDRDAGVGQREQRHDHVARPRVVELLQPLVRRERRRSARLAPSGRAPASAARGTAGTGRSPAPGRRGRRGRRRSAAPSPGRRRPGRRRTRDSATQAATAEQRRRPARTAPRAPGRSRTHAEDRRPRRAAAGRRCGRCRRRDDQQRDEVVDDGDGQQEGPQPVREARPDERRACRARTPCRWTSPRPSRAPSGLPGVDGEVDRDRHEHAADARPAAAAPAAAARAARPCRTRGAPPARRRGRRTSSARC